MSRHRIAVVLACLATSLALAAPTHASPFVYAMGYGNGTIAQYDAAGGPLAPLTPATIAPGGQPTVAVISPDRQSLYVTDQGASLLRRSRSRPTGR